MASRQLFPPGEGTNGRSISPTPSDQSSFLSQDPYPQRFSPQLYQQQYNDQHQLPNSPQTKAELFSRMEQLLKTKNDELTIAQGLVHMFEQQQQQLQVDLSRVAEAQLEFAASPDGRRSRAHNGDLAATADDSSDSGDDVGVASRQKLAQIESDMRNWDDQNKPQLHEIGARAQAGVPSLAQLEAEVTGGDPFAGSRSTSHHNFGEQHQAGLGSAAMSQSTGAGAAAEVGASRRARNNATHRGNDVDFAAEISGQLLMEIKRLQALLAERDDSTSHIERAKEGLEHELASLARERDLLKESSGEPNPLPLSLISIEC